MPIIVQKFGGTSVADIEHIHNVAQKVKNEVDLGNQVVVIVSAMAGVTNQLIDWANAAVSDHDDRGFLGMWHEVCTNGEFWKVLD